MEQRYLFIKLRALGDTVLATSAIRALDGLSTDQKSKIDVMVSMPWVEVLKEIPFIDGIIGVEEPRNFFAKIIFWWRVARNVRAQHYSKVFVLHASFKTAFIGWMATAFRSKQTFVNHHRLKKNPLSKLFYEKIFSTRPVLDSGVLKNNAERDLDAVKTAFPKIQKQETFLKVSDAERVLAEEKLTTLGWKALGQPLLFLGIGASRLTKRWSPEQFVELIQLVQKNDSRWKFILCSIPSDEPWLEKFLELTEKLPSIQENVFYFRGQSIREVMAIMKCCQGYVGNDSGLKHVAAALGLATTTVFGPEDPMEWHPYDLRLHPYLFINGLACRTEHGQHWCSLETCEKENNKCLSQITAEEVFLKLTHALKLRQESAPL